MVFCSGLIFGYFVIFLQTSAWLRNALYKTKAAAADIKQLQDDLTQEKEDNKQNPEEKKKALKEPEKLGD